MCDTGKSLDCSRLPTRRDWKLDDVFSQDQSLGRVIESACSPDKMINALSVAMAQSIGANLIRYGWEEASDARGGSRAVIQFFCGEDLSNQFFNSRTGYRAHFWSGPCCGLKFNCDIINALKETLRENLPPEIGCRLIKLNGNGISDSGATKVPLNRFLSSLHPLLAKVWKCTSLIDGNGGITFLPSGCSGSPKIDVDRQAQWVCICSENNDAWIDVKGAFVSGRARYQSKNYKSRATDLYEKGQA